MSLARPIHLLSSRVDLNGTPVQTSKEITIDGETDRQKDRLDGIIRSQCDLEQWDHPNSHFTVGERVAIFSPQPTIYIYPPDRRKTEQRWTLTADIRF